MSLFRFIQLCSFVLFSLVIGHTAAQSNCPADLETLGAGLSELDELVHVEQLSWKELGASQEIIERRILAHPSTFLIARVKNKAVGFVHWVDIENFNPSTTKAWKDYATLSESSYHAAQANCRFIVSMSVTPDAPPGTATKLLDALKIKTSAQNIPMIAYGGRIAGLRKAKSEETISPEQYYEKVLSGEIIEPSLRMGQKVGGVISKLLPNYFDDPDSLNYGVLILISL